MNILVIVTSGILLAIVLASSLYRYRFKARFIKAFKPELQALRNPETSVYQTLRKAFVRHQLAVNEFRKHLHGDALKAFDRAWENYYHHPAGNELDQYLCTDDPEEDEKRRDVALRRLEVVLQFAGYEEWLW